MNIIIEGIDHLGKSTIIEHLQHALGYCQIFHYDKPKTLAAYKTRSGLSGNPTSAYQHASFNTMFQLMKSSSLVTTPFIFDRAHLGESVYGPLYRGSDSRWIKDMERSYFVGNDELQKNTFLFLLTEDFARSKHFVDDGESFDISKRRLEQEMFIDTFTESSIMYRQTVCVTGPDGNFKSIAEILREMVATISRTKAIIADEIVQYTLFNTLLPN